MTEAIYGTIILVLLSVSGFTARYLFLKISKANELYASEFIRVDKELAEIKTEIKLHNQLNNFFEQNMKEDLEHLSNKVYHDADKLTVLIHRLEKIEMREEMRNK